MAANMITSALTTALVADASVSSRRSASVSLVPTSIKDAVVEDRFRNRLAKRNCQASQIYTHTLCARCGSLAISTAQWGALPRLRSGLGT
jgi:hypothetical protein